MVKPLSSRLYINTSWLFKGDVIEIMIPNSCLNEAVSKALELQSRPFLEGHPNWGLCADPMAPKPQVAMKNVPCMYLNRKLITWRFLSGPCIHHTYTHNYLEQISKSTSNIEYV